MYLNVGTQAPNFNLPNFNNHMVSLNEFRGSKILIWFFPKANTPGWTVEAKGFRDEFIKFDEKKIKIIGVSADSATKQKKFVVKYNFPFIMLCDEAKDMLKEYKAWGPKKFMGRSYIGIHRISYLINEKGIIEKVYDKVKTKSHAIDILNDLSWLSVIINWYLSYH